EHSTSATYDSRGKPSVREPLTNLVNCKLLIEEFENGTGLSLSEGECKVIDYLDQRQATRSP
ncbi:9145_t:CDS:2, partial [Gigaspora rosea]